MKEYSGNDSIIAPQFKTWFYIYKNNTIEDNFRKILAEEYLVEIKEIERFDNNFDSFSSSEPINNVDGGEDILGFEDFDKDFETVTSEETETSTLLDSTINYVGDEDKNSKFDRHVDDSQYVEVPEIRKKIKEEEDAAIERLNEKIQNQSSGPEKISLPIKKYMEDSMEIMETAENRHFVSRVRKNCKIIFMNNSIN